MVVMAAAKKYQASKRISRVINNNTSWTSTEYNKCMRPVPASWSVAVAFFV
jgi:hypothetical protein